MTATANATGATVESMTEFGAENLKANAAVYKDAKAIVDAASKFDSLADAQAALEHAWGVFESQIENGAEFTPKRELGFGSDNASVIAETILGRRNSVGATRKALRELGK